MKCNRIIARSLCAAVVLSTLLGGCIIYVSDSDGHNFRSKAKRTDELTAPLTDITALEVSTDLGGIRIEAGDVTEAAISAQITVRADTEEQAQGLLEGVRISIEPTDHRLIVKAVKPSDFGNNSLAVDYTITIPKQLEVHCTTHVGNVRITGLAGSVFAQTDLGKIDCMDLRGAKADLATNVGAIKLAYASDAPAALQIDAGTHVGNIDFSGPEHISAKFSAVTNVGNIDTSREMKVRGFVGKSLDASIDTGEGHIAFHTHVGAIHIR